MGSPLSSVLQSIPNTHHTFISKQRNKNIKKRCLKIILTSGSITTLKKHVNSRNSGKQRNKLETALNTNRHNPGGHERKIVAKLRNAEKNNLTRRERSTKKIVN